MWCVLPFCASDRSKLIELLEWMADLRGCPGHKALLVYDAATSSVPVLDAGRKVFDVVESLLLDPPVTGWPAGANALWDMASRWLEKNSAEPWLWLEPDAIPLRAGWLDMIQVAYFAAGKAFMGAIVDGIHSGSRLPMRYLNGVAVYPPDCRRYMPSIVDGEPFDLTWTKNVLPHAINSMLFHCHWGEHDRPPTFQERGEPGTEKWDLSRLQAEAVIFHRNKDGSLIRELKRHAGLSAKISKADIVSLRRAGDIINLLPLLQILSRKWSRPVQLVVHRQFESLLESVSYADAVPWDGNWEDALAASAQYQAVNAQVFGRGLKPTMHGNNFAKLAWKQIGYKWNRYLPLVLDQRSRLREDRLVNQTFKTAKPKILVKLHGHSSPFGEREFVRASIKALADQVELVWLDEVIAEQLYDLIGLIDHAACLLTSDTVTHWLAWASVCPVISFVNNQPFAASPPVSNTLLTLRYLDTVRRWPEILQRIAPTLEPTGNDQMVLVHQYFRPTDADTIRRQDDAWRTWPLLGARLHGFASERNATKLGDRRDVPFLRDMIQSAFTSGSEDICVVINNDIRVMPQLAESIRLACARFGCWWAHRVDDQRRTDHGADCFAFTRRWWNIHQHLLPDFVLGYWAWDDCLTRLMLWSGCREQDRLYLHEPHPRSDSATRTQTPGHRHNERLFTQWLNDQQEDREKPSDRKL